MHRPKPVIHPLTQPLHRLTVRAHRLFRDPVMLPPLVKPLTPKPPDQPLPSRLHRHPRLPIPRPIPLPVPVFSDRSLLSAHSFLNPPLSHSPTLYRLPFYIPLPCPRGLDWDRAVDPPAQRPGGGGPGAGAEPPPRGARRGARGAWIPGGNALAVGHGLAGKDLG